MNSECQAPVYKKHLIGGSTWELPPKYQFYRKMNQGAYGDVVAFYDTESRKNVAIKRVDNVFKDLTDAQRILREICVLIHFRNHPVPGVIAVESILLPSSPTSFNEVYLVTERMDQDLHQLIYSTENDAGRLTGSTVDGESPALCHSEFTTDHSDGCPDERAALLYTPTPSNLDSRMMVSPSNRHVLYQLIRTLAVLHNGTEIMHRDIKPSNILIDHKTGLIKLCDFGLAKSLTDTGKLPAGNSASADPGPGYCTPCRTIRYTADDASTASSPRSPEQVSGEEALGKGPEQSTSLSDYVVTRWYRPPEVIAGATNYGAEVDLWSLGCVAAELIDRVPLLPGRDQSEQLRLIVELLGTPALDVQERFFTRCPFPQLHDTRTAHSILNTTLNFSASGVAGRNKYNSSTVVNNSYDVLLDGFLRFLPESRLTAVDALLHPLFLEFTEADQLFHQLPRSPQHPWTPAQIVSAIRELHGPLDSFLDAAFKSPRPTNKTEIRALMHAVIASSHAPTNLHPGERPDALADTRREAHPDAAHKDASKYFQPLWVAST